MRIKLLKLKILLRSLLRVCSPGIIPGNSRGTYCACGLNVKMVVNTLYTVLCADDLCMGVL